MKARFNRCLAAIAACLLLSACTQWRYDLGESLAHEELPQQGTSLTRVLDQLGPPVRMSATDTGYVLAWEYWHIEEDSLGVSLGVMGADFLSADWGEMQVKGNFLLLAFDRLCFRGGCGRPDWPDATTPLGWCPVAKAPSRGP